MLAKFYNGKYMAFSFSCVHWFWQIEYKGILVLIFISPLVGDTQGFIICAVNSLVC